MVIPAVTPLMRNAVGREVREQRIVIVQLKAYEM